MRKPPISGWFLTRLLLLFVLFSGLALYTANLVGQTGGAGLIDTTWNYTPQQAHQILTRLGSAGRAAYLNWLALDAAYLVVYSLFFVSSAAWLLPRLVHGSASRWWMVAPLLPGVFDAAEDICVGVLLWFYPAPLEGLARLCNGFTMIKDVTFYICLLGLAVLFAQYSRRRRNQVGLASAAQER